MRQIKVLLKRDLFLVKANWKRILIVLGSIVLLDGLILLAEHTFDFQRSLMGITFKEFVESPRNWPYQWMLPQLAVMIVCFDLVRQDLFFHASSIIVRLKKRRYYWFSKLLAGMLVSIGATVFILIDKIIILSIFEAKACFMGFDIEDVLRSSICLLLCSFTLFCMYSLFTLLFHEILSFILSLAILNVGLALDNIYTMTNQFMMARGAPYFGFFWFISVLIVSVLLGAIIISKVDILSVKGEQ